MKLSLDAAKGNIIFGVIVPDVYPEDIWIVTSMQSYWEENHCMNDRYETEEIDMISDGFDKARIPAGEVMESCFEVSGGLTMDEVRQDLNKIDGFVYDKDFESWVAGRRIIG